MGAPPWPPLLGSHLPGGRTRPEGSHHPTQRGPGNPPRRRPLRDTRQSRAGQRASLGGRSLTGWAASPETRTRADRKHCRKAMGSQETNGLPSLAAQRLSHQTGPKGGTLSAGTSSRALGRVWQGQGAQGGLRGLIAPQSRAPPQTQQDTVDQRGRGPKTRWGSVTLGWHPGPGTPAIGGGMG